MVDDDAGLRERLAKQSEEALGKWAQELLESPFVSGALSAAFQSRERAMHAQEVAMGALNLPSATDLERLTRRLRGVSQRLEAIEDSLDDVGQRLGSLPSADALDRRLEAIEQALARIEAHLSVASTAGTSTRAKRSAGAVTRRSGGGQRSRPRATS